VRDFLTEEIDEVLCDDREAVERMNQLVEKISRRARNRLKFYDGATPIFEALGIQKQIDDAFHRQVWLRCGGLHRDRRDRSAGGGGRKHRPKQRRRDVEKTILQTNLEAADEIARQLRLRNIGGLIIADFIDMKGRKDQQAVFKFDEGTAQTRQAKNARIAHFAARSDGNDAATRAGKSKRYDLRKLPLLRRSRRRQNFHDHQCGTASDAQYCDA